LERSKSGIGIIENNMTRNAHEKNDILVEKGKIPGVDQTLEGLNALRGIESAKPKISDKKALNEITAFENQDGGLGFQICIVCSAIQAARKLTDNPEINVADFFEKTFLYHRLPAKDPRSSSGEYYPNGFEVLHGDYITHPSILLWLRNFGIYGDCLGQIPPLTELKEIVAKRDYPTEIILSVNNRFLEKSVAEGQVLTKGSGEKYIKVNGREIILGKGTHSITISFQGDGKVKIFDPFRDPPTDDIEKHTITMDTTELETYITEKRMAILIAKDGNIFDANKKDFPNNPGIKYGREEAFPADTRITEMLNGWGVGIISSFGGQPNMSYTYAAKNGQTPEQVTSAREAFLTDNEFTMNSVVMMNPAHGSNYFVVENKHAGWGMGYSDDPKHVSNRPVADILMTDVPRMGLLGTFGDCVPLVLAAKNGSAVALVHAGLRGTIGSVVEEAVGQMCEKYNLKPSDLVAVFGPSIGPKNYAGPKELRENLSCEMRERRRFGAQDGIDLQEINFQTLINLGIPRDSIQRCFQDPYDDYGGVMSNRHGTVMEVPSGRFIFGVQIKK